MNTKSNRVEKRPVRQILPSHERGFLEGVVADNQAQAKGGVGLEAGVTAGIPQGSETKLMGGSPEQTRRIQEVLNDTEPDSINRWEKSKLEAKEKELKAFITENLVPARLARVMPGSPVTLDPEFQKAISHMAKVEMDPKFVQVVEAWKNILRQLGREDDADMEFLRP